MTFVEALFFYVIQTFQMHLQDECHEQEEIIDVYRS